MVGTMEAQNKTQMKNIVEGYTSSFDYLYEVMNEIKQLDQAHRYLLMVRDVLSFLVEPYEFNMEDMSSILDKNVIEILVNAALAVMNYHLNMHVYPSSIHIKEIEAVTVKLVVTHDVKAVIVNVKTVYWTIKIIMAIKNMERVFRFYFIDTDTVYILHLTF